MSLLDTLKSVFGSAWHSNSDNILTTLANAIDGTATDVVPGTVTANGTIIAGPTKNVDTLDIAALKLGGISLSATAGQLNLADAKYATAALQSAIATAANVAGANSVFFENTGVTPGNLQFDTAANIVAAMPGAVIGQAYVLEVRNSSSGANTATMTTNTGLSLHGTMTIAQNTTRKFVVVLTSLSAIDIYSMGVSQAAA